MWNKWEGKEGGEGQRVVEVVERRRKRLRTRRFGGSRKVERGVKEIEV